MAKAEIERIILDLAGQGKSYQVITDYLNESGIPSLKGGKWHKGVVGKIGKRLQVSRTVDTPKPANASSEPDTQRKAYQAVLAELDTAKKEIGALRADLSEKESELKKQMQENKHNGQRELTEMLDSGLTHGGTSGSDGILSEILDRLTAIERKIGIPAGKEKQSLNIAGWSIQRDHRGFHRAFRNIRGKVRAVYLGKDLSDIQAIEHKLTAKYKVLTNGGKI